MTFSIRTGVIALAAAGLLAAAILLPARLKPEPAATPRADVAIPVELAEVRTGPIRTGVSYAGNIQAAGTVNLAPKAAGQVASIAVGVGSVVKAGDRLATLDPGTLAAQVLQAEAGVAAAEARLKVVQDGATAADVAAAAQAVFTADAAFTTAQSNLDAIMARADNVTRAQTARQQADRIAGQKAPAQAAIDRAIAAIPAGNTFGVNLLTGSIRDLDAAVLTRCDRAAARDACATAALEQTSLGGLVDGVNRATGGVPSDLTVELRRYEEAAASLNLQSLTPQVFLLVQASAGSTGLTARASSLALSLNSAAGIPSNDTITAAQRTRDAASAALAAAKARLTTLQEGPTNADMLTSRATVAQARAALSVARAALDQTAVLAPFDGIVTQKLAEVGSSVSPSSPLFVITANAVELHLAIEEARISLVKPDLVASLTSPAFPGKTFRARVSSIAPSADPRARSFDVTVFADDPDKVLRPGMSANVTITTAEKPGATLVPNAAVATQGNQSSVLTVVDGQAKRRPITIGITDGASTEVLDGLKPGDQVVVVGQNVAREGQAVRVVTPAPRRPAGGG